MLHDPTPHRVSACPVHFLWDGRGHGRVLVRAGFLGFLLAGMALSLSRWLFAPQVKTVGLVVALGAAALWGAGQLATFLTDRRAALARR
jgi:hypothetical protein